MYTSAGRLDSWKLCPRCHQCCLQLCADISGIPASRFGTMIHTGCYCLLHACLWRFRVLKKLRCVESSQQQHLHRKLKFPFLNGRVEIRSVQCVSFSLGLVANLHFAWSTPQHRELLCRHAACDHVTHWKGLRLHTFRHQRHSGVLTTAMLTPQQPTAFGHQTVAARVLPVHFLQCLWFWSIMLSNSFMVCLDAKTGLSTALQMQTRQEVDTADL